MKKKEFWQSHFGYFKENHSVKTLTDLQNDVERSLAANQLYLAKKSAQSAAANYYAPGLILLMQVQLAECKSLFDEGSSYESQLAQCYTTFILCKNQPVTANDKITLDELKSQMDDLDLSPEIQAEREEEANGILKKMNSLTS